LEDTIVAYESVDILQKILAQDIFHYTQDAKKAAGRALGTLVEVITFYVLKSWGLEYSIGIERGLAEFGNPEITHNVEYSLHPLLRESHLAVDVTKRPITSAQILSKLRATFSTNDFHKINATLLTRDDILRNACTIAASNTTRLVAFIDADNAQQTQLAVIEQFNQPYAIFECKRVGIEEGMRKGPQTIEKAKQGAYVARAVSSLHKIRTRSGELRGLVYKGNQIYSKPYAELIAEIIESKSAELLRGFILTVGIVSNHGNWFTSENHNKELKVLAQSYDWLLFLTDGGLAEFITELLLQPKPLLEPARQAFLASYQIGKKSNRFTKVQMDYRADQVLQTYFHDNRTRIENWFNIIGPKQGSVDILKSQLTTLRAKNWRKVYEL